MEEFFSKVGLKGAHLFTGLIAGAIGLVFNKAPKTKKERLRAFALVVAGAVVTGYLTPLIVHWKPFFGEVEYAIAFIMGLFGMGIIDGILSFINQFKNDPIGVIVQLKEKFLGGPRFPNGR